MACGVPVVTTNVFGPSEIITNELDGLVVNPNDVSALVRAIRTLLDDKQMRMKMGAQGRITVEKRFDINQHLENLVGIYQDLM